MNNIILFVFVLVAGVHVCLAEEVVSFRGYKVIRAVIERKEQVQYVEDQLLDVWSGDGKLAMNAANDIMLKSEHIAELEARGVKYSLIIDDVEEHLNKVASAPRVRSVASAASPFFDSYHVYNDIIAFIVNITATYPKLCTYVPAIGVSIEGRNIPAVEITGGKNPAKSIFISGGQHAREWIAPAVTLYIMESLLTLYGKDADVTSLLDATAVYIVPLVNPDGYAYTQTNRMWRKNRRHNSGGSYGVDLNRNWDEHWCEYGASRVQASDTYCGTAPFSEPETKATSQYILKHKHSAVIDYHSYGELILRPYGYTTALPPTEALLKSVGDGIAATIKSKSGKNYTSEHGADLYPASGAADDWSYVKAQVPLVYTIELRDNGTYGFQLPANQIVPTGDENFAAFKYLATRI